MEKFKYFFQSLFKVMFSTWAYSTLLVLLFLVLIPVTVSSILSTKSQRDQIKIPSQYITDEVYKPFLIDEPASNRFASPLVIIGHHLLGGKLFSRALSSVLMSGKSPIDIRFKRSSEGL
jgi:hypothetical protein